MFSQKKKIHFVLFSDVDAADKYERTLNINKQEAAG